MTEEEKAFDKVKKGVKEVVGGTAGVVEGTAQGIKEAVEDTKEGVEETARDATDKDMHTSSYEDTKNREYNEAEEKLEDAGDKVKAGAKAVANKVEDPDKDLESEYRKEKFEEKVD
jgi:hypothetical protein